MKKLPRTLYVARHNEGTNNEFLNAHESQEFAVEDDGPTLVGTYQLVKSEVLEKVLQLKKPNR